jgi:hypothetical protein
MVNGGWRCPCNHLSASYQIIHHSLSRFATIKHNRKKKKNRRIIKEGISKVGKKRCCRSTQTLWQMSIAHAIYCCLLPVPDVTWCFKQATTTATTKKKNHEKGITGRIYFSPLGCLARACCIDVFA